ALRVRHVTRRRPVPVAGAIFAGYWAAFSLVPVPGHGAGHLSPAGNLTGYIDRTLLGARHLYGNGPSDPEGLLSTLPAVVTVLMGYWASECLREEPRRLVRVGVACVLAGLAWHPLFPMNKKLWTSSYVLFTGGCALLVLAGVHRLVNFDDRPVPADVLERVLVNATHAPSAGFAQGWAFVVLEGREQTEAFWRLTTDDAWRARTTRQGLFDAPVIVLPLAHKQAYLERY